MNTAMRKGIEVKILESFPIIQESLSRIGIRSQYEKKLWPSCYIYMTRVDGKVYIAHFKELLKNPNMSEDDEKRRNTILWVLHNWGFIEIEDIKLRNTLFENKQERKLCILSKKQIEEESWEIIPKCHENTLYYHSMNGMPRKEKSEDTEVIEK